MYAMYLECLMISLLRNLHLKLVNNLMMVQTEWVKKKFG